jgi:hypothetical protein
MGTSERRITPRFNLDIQLSFYRSTAAADGEQHAKAIDISTRGVYFATSLQMRVGESVVVVVEIPKQVTGTNGSTRRFAGRVTHIESKDMPEGLSGVGVELLYYERDLMSIEMNEDVNLAARRNSFARR